jgi:hypothetical protein
MENPPALQQIVGKEGKSVTSIDKLLADLQVDN